MNTVCVEKPSEGILTSFHPREVTQERNEMNVKNVGECLLTLHPFGPTRDLIRNPMRGKAFGHHSSFMTHVQIHAGEKPCDFDQCGRGHTVGRSCTNGMTVERLHPEQEPDRE